MGKDSSKQWKRNIVQIFPQKVNLLPQRTACFLLAIIFNLSQIYFYYNLNVSVICHNIIIMRDTKIAKYSRHLIPFYRIGNYSPAMTWLQLTAAATSACDPHFQPCFLWLLCGVTPKVVVFLLLQFNWLGRGRWAARGKKELKLVQFIRMNYWFLLPGCGHSFGLIAHSLKLLKPSVKPTHLIPKTTWDTLESEKLGLKGPFKGHLVQHPCHK